MQLEFFPESIFHHDMIRQMLLSFVQKLNIRNIEIAVEYWAYSYEVLTIPILIGTDSCK